MKRLVYIKVLLLFLVCCFGAAAAELPNITSAMQTPSFWIARDSSAEEVILDAGGVAKLNRAIYNLNEYMYRLEDIGEEISGEEVKDLIGDPQMPPKTPYYNAKGKLYSQKFYADLLQNMNLETVPETNKITFGLTVTRTNMRTHPTLEAALKKPGEKDFDRFQDTSIEPAQFAAKIHSSQDGKFAYVLAAYDRGWVLEKDIAWAKDKKEVEAYFQSPKTLVNLAPKTAVYQGLSGKNAWASIHMGTTLPLLKSDDKKPWVVKLPGKNAQGELTVKHGHIPWGAEVQEGFLPYSPANIIRQAFKLLGDPYDWGGKKGGRDCSQFLLEVFAACGVNLPRNSFYQAEAAAELFTLTSGVTFPPKEEVLKEARPGITLLQMPGHIMLYLGEYQGRFYVIHDTWGYNDLNGKNKLIKIAKVAVTDLSLEKKNPARSLFERITRIAEVNHNYPWE